MHVADLVQENPSAVIQRITPVNTSAEVWYSVDLIQGNISKTVEAKIGIGSQMDVLTCKDTVLASSTSWLPASLFTKELAGRDRGERGGLTTEERERMKQLERENRELRRANEILKGAAVFFFKKSGTRRFRRSLCATTAGSTARTRTSKTSYTSTRAISTTKTYGCRRD